MDEELKGILILESISDDADKEEIVDYFFKILKNTPKEKIEQIISKTPVTLIKNIRKNIGDKIIVNLTKLKASASFRIIETAGKTNQELDKTIPDNIPRETSEPITQINSHIPVPPSYTKKASKNIESKIKQKLMEVNKELWLILSMFIIVGLMNFLIIPSQMILSFYVLPTLFAAYFFGKRHAVLTAFASIFLVSFVVYFMPNLFQNLNRFKPLEDEWFNLTIWGGILVITAYTMGTLYERHKEKLLELYSTYQGILIILRHFISKDKYTENHCYRVSVYAAKIAAYLGLGKEKIEDVRAAALLHDLGKLDISRELLYKAAALSKEELSQMKHHPEMGADMLESIKGPLGRIIPIILSHHDKFDGSGYHQIKEEQIPLEARVIAVADVYDALASDRPYRKAMSPLEVKEQISKGAGTEFDPKVVDAFMQAFKSGEMEISNIMV
jgi:putative nucleotidyltransferase with HDIG domain